MRGEEYIVLGKITGNECTSFVVFESCKRRTIDAVSGPEGKLYSVKSRYSQVSEYRDGRCWINHKSLGGGLISGAINLFSNVQFYEKQTDGKYEKIDPEYLIFKCRKE